MSQDPKTYYLDYAATTPVAPEVVDAMLPWIGGAAGGQGYGNASSIHALGRMARTAIDDARDSVAELIGADYSEITFTSSGTEADNLALWGSMAASARRHLIITSIEHHAVLHSAYALSKTGIEVTTAPVNSAGIVIMETLEGAIRTDTALVSVMHANNEIGTIQPIQEIARIAHDKGAIFHTDAVQSAGIVELNVKSYGCDLVSLSAHKLYGPKGAGALYIRSGTTVSPILYGGAQERERRAGTENVAAIVGFGVAARIAKTRLSDDAARITCLRDRFIDALTDRIPDTQINGDRLRRLPNNINVSVLGVEGSTILMNLDRAGIYTSSGAACSSGSIEPSHVLRAIGLSSADASAGIRFSLGRDTTWDELDEVIELLATIVKRLRRS